MASWRHLRAIAVLPGTVAVLIPILILSTAPSQIGWHLPRPMSWQIALVGAFSFAGGIALMASTIRLFTQVGEGTLAPWDPTRRLVLGGIYRHVRNPMISGVFAVLLGEALFFGSLLLLLWFALFVAGNIIYIPLSEEPGLESRFGDDYREYRRHVPRWIPRLRPWEPS